MKARLEPAIPSWVLIIACAVVFVIQLAPSVVRSSAPSVSADFWIIESDPQSGTLVATDSVSESDPRIRAWCNAMGYQSEGKPFPIGLAFYRTRGLYIKIMTPEGQEWEYAGVLPDEDYLPIAHAARDWAETKPSLRRYMGSLIPQDPARSGTWGLDPTGILISILFDVLMIWLVFRGIQSVICGRRSRLQRQRLDASLCVACGYEIANPASTVCSECGHSVPPLDPAPSA